MTTTSLQLTNSAVLDNTGMASISFVCPTGQYWLPMTCHVGSNMQNGPHVPQAGVHIGGPNIYDFTTVVDFTFAGNNDTTSLISGDIVNPSQAIAAHFVGGNPGDTVYTNIVGIVSDVPPTIGINPLVPGSHFSGAPGAFGAPVGAQTYPTAVINIDNSITNGTPLPLLTALANNKYFLHTLQLDIDPGADVSSTVALQDNHGNSICTFRQTYIGAAAGQFVPERAPMDLKGLPLPVGFGLQLSLLTAGTVNAYGFISYNSAGD